MTAPLTGAERVVILDHIHDVAPRRPTLARFLRQALDLIDAQAAALDAAGDLLLALPPGHLAPERDGVLAQIDALVTGRHTPNPAGDEA